MNFSLLKKSPFLGFTSAVALGAALLVGTTLPGHATEAAKPIFKNKISHAQLLSSLREGGYVIYIRHTQTTKDYADQASAKLDLNNCATQRELSTKGIDQAKNIGLAIKKGNIPVGKVFSSDYCRAWKTADLAFGRYERTPALNFVKAENYTDAQKAQMRDAVMPLLTAVPEAKTNTVLVGHDDVFDAATGIYPEPQGMAFFLKPDGKGKFDILANLSAEGWTKLVR